jgi:hypothetical protein
MEKRTPAKLSNFPLNSIPAFWPIALASSLAAEAIVGCGPFDGVLLETGILARPKA